MNDTTEPRSVYGFISPSIFHRRSPGLKGRVDVYRVATLITACVCTFVSVHLEQWIRWPIFLLFLFFFFSDLYMSVVLFLGYIESMFFCESSVGKGAVWVDLSDLNFIFNFCATLAHPEENYERFTVWYEIAPDRQHQLSLLLIWHSKFQSSPRVNS